VRSKFQLIEHTYFFDIRFPLSDSKPTNSSAFRLTNCFTLKGSPRQPAATIFDSHFLQRVSTRFVPENLITCGDTINA